MDYDAPANVKKPSDVKVHIHVIPGDFDIFQAVGEEVSNIGSSRVEDLGVVNGVRRMVANRKMYTVRSFKKIEVDGNDVSEVTIKNNDSGAEFVLPLKKFADVPGNRCVVFRYRWRLAEKPETETKDFSVFLGRTFTLKPDEEKEYRLIEITGVSVKIELPDGTRKTLAVPK
jgi:hypothetical protein